MRCAALITRLTFALVCFLGSFEPSLAQTAAPSAHDLRFPDVCGERIAFSYAGDVWIVSSRGGIAARLTSDAGLELFPKFSPDCQTLAFTAQYGGDDQVYTVPVAGGSPTRLTSYPSWGPLAPRWGTDNQVTGWTADGSSVVFRSFRDSSQLSESRLYTIKASGGDAVALPMPRSGAGVFSPDGRSLLYSPLSRDFRTWKRYQGGWAQDLWTLELATGTLRNITHDPRTDRDPMWTDRGMFFISDRDGHLNLYAYDPERDAARQLTHYTDADAKWASADRHGQIVYELEGRLHLYDASSGVDHALSVTLATDDPAAQPRSVATGRQIESFDVSPDGAHALFVARGDVYVLAIGEGVVRNVTHSSSAHDREAAWRRDGEAIAFVSDTSGEEELWVAVPDGLQAARQVTRGHQTRFYHPIWAPNGRKVALIDKTGNLLEIDIASGATRVIGATGAWYAQDYAWSPDSRFLAYAELQPTNYAVIKIWDGLRNQTHVVTSALSNAFEPAWSPDGRFLYFLADHEFTPQITGIEWNFAVTRQTSIYALALAQSTQNPFYPKDGEVETPPPVAAHVQTPEVRIDFDGLEKRLIRVPVAPDNLSGLAVTSDRLLYRKAAPNVFGRTELTDPRLFEFDLPKQREREIAQDVLALSANLQGAVLVRQPDNRYSLVKGDAPAKPLDTERLRALIVPREEWQEIFDETWRRFRDYFYADNMHGHDWAAIKAHYQRLLPSLGNRADLNYLIGEMIAELNVSHAYIEGPDERPSERTPGGTLGARLAFDAAVGCYRFVHVLRGENADPMYRSPLTEVGSAVMDGEHLIAIDGERVGREQDPYTLLRGKAEKVVELAVAPDCALQRSRKVRVRTLASDRPLIYLERVRQNLQRVEELSGGRLGYVFIPNMGPAGLREFIRQYYGQIRKDGLIIDVRGNAGGSVSRMILERLTRAHYGMGFITGVQSAQTYPWGGYTQVFTGEMVMLINEYTQSDGDTIAWTWKQTGRTLIGKRTWGGVIGTGDTGPLLDGGAIHVPQFALAGKQGEWVVEGEGVPPDIEVDYDQGVMKTGRDPQLETAVATLLERTANHPGTLPGPQPYPVRP
jgi:tricorn protease